MSVLAEVAASDVVGMEVRAGSRLSVGLLPDFHLTMNNVHIGQSGGSIAAWRGRAKLRSKAYLPRGMVICVNPARRPCW
jgi:hypothetical protein